MSKLYVIVRQDLPKNYQAVQAGHAVAQYALSFPETWKNETLIYLKVSNEQEIFQWMENLKENGCDKFTPFYEPDIGDQATAMAFLSTPVTDKMAENVKLV